MVRAVVVAAILTIAWNCAIFWLAQPANAQWLRGSPYGWPHYGVYQQWCCWGGFNPGPRYYNPDAYRSWGQPMWRPYRRY
jgi:hypothetical protein